MSWSEIKYAINSTLGTEDFAPLDEMIKGAYAIKNEYKYPGTYPLKVPRWAKYALITACGGGGAGGYGYSSASDYTGASGGGGGGGAAVYQEQYSIENLAGTTINITIGAGGTANDKKPYASDGGSTIISGIVTLPGGKAGTSPGDTNNIYNLAGGAAGGSGGGAGGTGGNSGQYITITKPQPGSPGITGPGSPVRGNGGGGGGSLGSYDNEDYNYGAGGYGDGAYTDKLADYRFGRGGYALIMFSPTSFE